MKRFESIINILFPKIIPYKGFDGAFKIQRKNQPHDCQTWWNNDADKGFWFMKSFGDLVSALYLQNKNIAVN